MSDSDRDSGTFKGEWNSGKAYRGYAAADVLLKYLDDDTTHKQAPQAQSPMEDERLRGMLRRLKDRTELRVSSIPPNITEPDMTFLMAYGSKRLHGMEGLVTEKEPVAPATEVLGILIHDLSRIGAVGRAAQPLAERAPERRTA